MKIEDAIIGGHNSSCMYDYYHHYYHCYNHTYKMRPKVFNKKASFWEVKLPLRIGDRGDEYFNFDDTVVYLYYSLEVKTWT